MVFIQKLSIYYLYELMTLKEQLENDKLIYGMCCFDKLTGKRIDPKKIRLSTDGNYFMSNDWRDKDSVKWLMPKSQLIIEKL